MGFDPSLDQAARVAVRSLLDLLERFGGMAWRDAYRLASIAADLRVTQVVNGEKGIHVMLERTILATRDGAPVPLQEADVDPALASSLPVRGQAHGDACEPGHDPDGPD